jgi:hypothetical protein
MVMSHYLSFATFLDASLRGALSSFLDLIISPLEGESSWVFEEDATGAFSFSDLMR